MPHTIDLLVLVHGITPERWPTPREQYQPFLRALERAEPSPLERMHGVVQVQWGTPQTGIPERADEWLAGAQRAASKRVAFAEVERDTSPENELLKGPLGGDWGVPWIRGVWGKLREELVQFGLADAIYYAADGEQHVREAVYGQVLSALEPHAEARHVRLHVVGHSLGVTVVHDFLFGLFGPGESSFTRSGSDDAAVYQRWRARAAAGTLTLGTHVSFASQLPLMMMRKQSLVQGMAQGELLDPGVVGIRAGDTATRWLIMYDIDDVLGFATRRLYRPHPAIRDVQVDTGDMPLGAHLNYWKDAKVIQRCVQLLLANTE